jgi:KDO2-lipid IV(A) lauroyltransferase
LAALPLPILHALSRLFAWLAWRVFPYEARVVRDSLTKAFPERSVAEREALRRDFYRGYGDVMVEIIKSASIDGRVLDERMRFGNLATLRAAIAADGPVVLLAAHQCNWEWILLGLSRNLGFPVDAAYKPLKNAWADREMLALRSRFGARMIPAERVMRDLISRRSVPRLIALVADQEPVASDRRHWTRFLNRETAFFMGADVIATSLGYPVFFVAIERTGRGRYLASFEVLRAAGEALAPGELTERYARRVERQIHQAPADWPWSHKRWRLRRPGDASRRESSL